MVEQDNMDSYLAALGKPVHRWSSHTAASPEHAFHVLNLTFRLCFTFN